MPATKRQERGRLVKMTNKATNHENIYDQEISKFHDRADH